jgi:hypothetical protein
MNTTENPTDLISFDKWLKGLGRTRTTGHRWRRKWPWLKTINIFGRVYVSRQVIEEFERRARAGEFERDVHPPDGRWDMH